MWFLLIFLEGPLIDAATAAIIMITNMNPPKPLIIGHIIIVEPSKRLKNTKKSTPNNKRNTTNATIAPLVLFL